MRIICIDDERLVLELTVSLCREMPIKPETFGFFRSADALEWLKENTADIAILDINMPDIDGITLAAEIKKIRPEISIIFLTGHAEYALDAFALHASGYILKPVGKDRLLSEIRFAVSHNSNISSKQAHITVHTFGEFDLIVDGSVVSFQRAKSKELLAYLVDRQGNSVSRANAFAVLYEDKVYDRSMQKQFDVVIRSLRDTLHEHGVEDIFELSRGNMRICPEKIECDLYDFIKGDISAVNSYRGEYMNSYSWAAMTEAIISESKK